MSKRLIPICCAMALAVPGVAQAEITITRAEYAEGYTWVRGEIERPLARVTMDKQYSTLSDRVGTFEFRVRYLPEDCVVDLRAGRDTHPVTIGNCFLQGRGVKPLGRIPR